MRRRWLVVEDLGSGQRIIVGRYWTRWGARSCIQGFVEGQAAVNKRVRKMTAPGSKPLPSPYPKPPALKVVHRDD